MKSPYHAAGNIFDYMNESSIFHSFQDDYFDSPQNQFQIEQPHNFAPHVPITLPTLNPTITEMINPNHKKLDYKNLPKQIGNKFTTHAKKLKQQQHMPIGVQKLIKKIGAQKQPKSTIVDLAEMCQDQESRKMFKEYMKSEFLLDLMFSNKVEQPMLFVPGICNYYSAADEPEKMKGNYIVRQSFV